MTQKKYTKASEAQRKSAQVDKRLQQQLQAADRHIANAEWHLAHSELVDLYRRFPDNPEILSRLLETSYESGDTERYQEACEKLLTLVPEEAELTLALAGAYLLNARPALARRTFLDFSEKWPEHPSREEVKNSLIEIDQYLAQQAAQYQLDYQQAVRLMEMHERMQSLHYQGHNRQAIRTGEELLKQFPGYVPVYNNLSQLHWQLDQRDKALRLAGQALEIDGDNLPALANLAIFQLQSGRVEQARETATRLHLDPADSLAHFQRAVEAFSYLGDDERVLAAYASVRDRQDLKQAGQAAASLHHLAAAAFLRAGQEQQAALCWDLALQASPDYYNARLNREDLGKPVHLRQAPWSFSITQWLPEKVIREILAGLDPSLPEKEQGTLQRKVRAYLAKYPQVSTMAPFMLELGDASARDFILLLARYSDQYGMLASLKDFALGQRGPDQLRLEAARLLVSGGELEPGLWRMWINSQWMDILLADIQIATEQREKHVEQVSALYAEAVELLAAGDAQTASSLLQAALSLEPGSPDILYNLAAAYQLQGQVEQARELVEQVHHAHPDYFFGRTGMAQLLLQQGDVQAAREMIAPLFRLRRMSPAELDAFCSLNIDLQLAAGRLPAARAWFGFWESANPQNHRLEAYHEKLEHPYGASDHANH